jgi:hypothetical protein
MGGVQAVSDQAAGGCACGAVRYRLLREPLFVHCCHCTRCQRETGGPFAHHALIEFSAFAVERGEIEAVKVPTDSGATHRVMRCAACKTAMWNEWGAARGPRRGVTRYVRVGTLDEPQRFAPQAHIFVRSRQPWLMLDAATPAFQAYYDAARLWPAASLDRHLAARAEAKAEAETRAKPEHRGPAAR